jgi:DNA-binding transcriptional LysR family regulator
MSVRRTDTTGGGSPGGILYEALALDPAHAIARSDASCAQRVGRSVRQLVASSEYARNHGVPSLPDELGQHPCVLINARNNEAEWHLVSGRKSAKVRVSGPVAARDFHVVSAFALLGHGIALLPSSYCDPHIASGKLVRVLPEWSSPEIFVHAVYPTRRFMPSRLKAFLDALKAWDGPLWLPLR